ncbi:MAG TPA: alcohol dehydrogenase catalytic domain-containing protein, partial [Acidobacteriota bacterium]|nr:alcohol dehydrogenase catalytic domain-containing protein [Acidobacteriota bacterium]
MRAYEIRGSFGLENLTLIERDGPREPGPGEVLVRVQAVSLNYRDLMTVWGNYNPRQPLPLIPCSDAAGVVEKVGPGLERIREGQTVCTT